MFARASRASLLFCATLFSACGGDEAPKTDVPAADPAKVAAPEANKTPPTPEGPVELPAPADVAAAPADAKVTASGLAYKTLSPGTGDAHPVAESKVKVHYTGWTTDGKMFDSSVTRGRPATFGLDGVIPGWTEGLQLMVVGEKTRFWIPAELAYGDTPKRPGAPSGQLCFDVELIEVK